MPLKPFNHTEVPTIPRELAGYFFELEGHMFDTGTGGSRDYQPYETETTHRGTYTGGRYNWNSGVLAVVAQNPVKVPGKLATYVGAAEPLLIDALKKAGFTRLEGMGVPQVFEEKLFMYPHVYSRARACIHDDMRGRIQSTLGPQGGGGPAGATSGAAVDL